MAPCQRGLGVGLITAAGLVNQNTEALLDRLPPGALVHTDKGYDSNRARLRASRIAIVRSASRDEICNDGPTQPQARSKRRLRGYEKLFKPANPRKMAANMENIARIF